MAALAETFFTSPLKPLNCIFMFFGPIGKTKWLPWSLIGWDIFDFSEETAEQNSTKLDRKQALSRLFFSGQSGKLKWPPCPLIGLDILDFFSETAERNLTKLDRKQDLNALYLVCVFQVDRKKKKQKWPPRPMIYGDIFNFSSETAE